MPTIYKEVEVEVDLDDFETDDLIKELEHRGEIPSEDGIKELVDEIWQRRRLSQDFDYALNQLIYRVSGKIL